MIKAALPTITSSVYLHGAATIGRWGIQALGKHGGLMGKVLADDSQAVFGFSAVLGTFLPDHMQRWRLPVELESDLAWKILLPCSLVAAILGGYQSRSKSADGKQYLQSVQHKTVKIFAAFAFGTIGSWLGGLLTILLLTGWARWRGVVDSQALALHVYRASCLTASYIGGTANLFETAGALHLQGSAMESIRSLAAIDISIMIAYFSWLTFFRSRAAGSSQSVEEDGARDNVETKESSHPNSNMLKVYTAVLVSAISVGITALASSAQQRVNIAGIAIVLSTSLALLLSTGLRLFIPTDWPWQKGAQGVSGAFLGMFYAALGLHANLKYLFSSGAASLFTFAITLFTHFTSLILLVKAWNRLAPPDLRIDTDSALLASNACVGGSATAANMAATFNREDLLVGAAWAGLLGYVVGTPGGLLLCSTAKRLGILR
eukprot:gene2319-2541_t